MIFLRSLSSFQQYVGGPLSVESYPIMDAVNDWMGEACESESGTLIGQIPTESFFCSSIRLFVYNHPSLILCTQNFADNNPQFTEDNGHFVNVRAFLVAYKFTINDLNIDCIQECDSGRMCCRYLRPWYYLSRRTVSKCRLSVHWGQRRRHWVCCVGILNLWPC